MKVKKLVAAMAMMLSAHTAHAVCVQQTTIFYINGVDNTKEQAEESKQNLNDALILDPRYRVHSDCTTVKLAYNKTEGRIADFAEALRQRTLEAGLTATNFWEMWERLIPSQNWFVEQFRTTMSTEQVLYDARDPAILAQINEHIDTLYRLEPAGNQLLFVAHSQGNFFGNEERLGLLERFPQVGARVKMVSVATPSNNVAGDLKPYTTLTEDKIIGNNFAAALPALTTNGDNGARCSILAGLDEWICHSFIDSYMFPESKSRKEIVDNVIATAFPVGTVLGTVRSIGGGLAGGSTVSLFSGTTLIAETLADTQGLYRFDNIPAPCPDCFVKAKSVSGTICASVPAPVVSGGLSVADITLEFGSCDAPPTVPNQFFGTIVDGHFLQLRGFVPDSDSWAIMRDNYDTPDYLTWLSGLCIAFSGQTIGNLDWLTFDYEFLTGGRITGNFSTTGVDLNSVSCQTSGTQYLAAYDSSHGDWRTHRVLKGVVVLTRIDATHWTTVAP